MLNLSQKKALILGLANERSIAWGIASALASRGVRLGFSYLNDALAKRVIPLAETLKADFTFELDVTRDEHFTQMKETVEKAWGSVDIVIHSLAFADKEDLKGSFKETSRKGFQLAHDVSAFSLIGICHALRPLMSSQASVVALTYHGSVAVVKNYNVMGVAKASLESSMRYLADDLGPLGIRVNCISAGPIKTLAASGISGFREILNTVEQKSPLRRNVTIQDVGETAAFLASDSSAGITGQVLYVDSGLSIIAAT